MEWNGNDVCVFPVWLCCYNHLRCIWFVGVWSLPIFWRVVPTGVAGVRRDFHITVKELMPVVVGIALWGRMWQGKSIHCLCDNAAVVAILGSGTSKNEQVMHLMKSLFFLAAANNITIVGEHIPGVQNGAADALSRNNCSSFVSQVQGAKPAATALPPELVGVLVHRQPDWTSVNWMKLLESISPRAWLIQRSDHTGPARTSTRPFATGQS